MHIGAFCTRAHEAITVFAQSEKGSGSTQPFEPQVHLKAGSKGVCIYIYLYIYRERDRDRDSEKP